MEAEKNSKTMKEALQAMEESLQAMEEAKTPEEMIASWNWWRPETEQRIALERQKEQWGVYMDKAPEFFEYFLHNPMWMMERGTLDSKTLALVAMACFATLGNAKGVRYQAEKAITTHGATVEEIMQIMHVVLFVTCKNTAGVVSSGLTTAFKVSGTELSVLY